MVDWTMYVSLKEAHTLEGKTSHQRGSCKCLCTIRCALRQVEASHLSCPVPTSRQTQPVMAGGLPPQGQVSQWDLPVSVSVKPRREQDPVRAPPCLPKPPPSTFPDSSCKYEVGTVFRHFWASHRGLLSPPQWARPPQGKLPHLIQ